MKSLKAQELSESEFELLFRIESLRRKLPEQKLKLPEQEEVQKLLDAAQKLIDSPHEAEAVLQASQKFFAAGPQKSALIVMLGVASNLVLIFVGVLCLLPYMLQLQNRDSLEKELRDRGYTSAQLGDPTKTLSTETGELESDKDALRKELSMLADKAQEAGLIFDWDRENESKLGKEPELSRLLAFKTKIEDSVKKAKEKQGVGKFREMLSKIEEQQLQLSKKKADISILEELSKIKVTELPFVGSSVEFFLGIVAATSAGVLVSVYWRIRELDFQSTDPWLLFLVSFLNGFVAIIVSVMLILGIKSRLIPIQFGSEQTQQDMGLYYLAFAFGWFERLAKDTFENAVSARFTNPKQSVGIP